jgi:hypothetical protein
MTRRPFRFSLAGFGITCLGIDPGYVWPFVIVAGETGKREVREFVSAMMLTSNDVINLKDQDVVLLRQSAVLA